MNSFAYCVHHADVRRIDPQQAVTHQSELVWIHRTDSDAAAQAWLCHCAGLPDIIVDALTASETRPRCDAVGEGVILNLRGRSNDAVPMSDPLASVRIWAVAGRLISVTRRPLTAIALVEAELASGAIHDPGDLIAVLRTLVTF